MSGIQKISWKTREVEKLNDSLSRQAVFGEKGTLAQLFIKRGGAIVRHPHVNKEYSSIVSGAVKYVFNDCEAVVNAGEVLVVPPNVPHSVVALEDTVWVIFFSPAREDGVRGGGPISSKALESGNVRRWSPPRQLLTSNWLRNFASTKNPGDNQRARGSSFGEVLTLKDLGISHGQWLQCGNESSGGVTRRHPSVRFPFLIASGYSGSQPLT